jgi:hypothetical protein
MMHPALKKRPGFLLPGFFRCPSSHKIYVVMRACAHTSAWAEAGFASGADASARVGTPGRRARRPLRLAALGTSPASGGGKWTVRVRQLSSPVYGGGGCRVRSTRQTEGVPRESTTQAMRFTSPLWGGRNRASDFGWGPPPDVLAALRASTSPQGGGETECAVRTMPANNQDLRHQSAPAPSIRTYTDEISPARPCFSTWARARERADPNETLASTHPRCGAENHSP